MDRRVSLGTLAGGLLAAPLAAEAQQPIKIARVGYLALNPAANPQLHEAFRHGLRDLRTGVQSLVSGDRTGQSGPMRGSKA